MKTAGSLVLALAAFGAQGVGAVTLIESNTATTPGQKMWLAGSQARIDMEGQPGYMLQDLSQDRMYMVQPERRMAMEMGNMFSGDAEAPPTPDYDLDARGAGPEIAGYDTRHYVLKVDGKVCQEFYTAPALADNDDLSGYIEAMTQSAMSRAGQRLAAQDPCMAAMQALTRDRGDELGFPVRTIKNGRTEFEVTRVREGVDVEAGFFEVPAGYQVMDMGQMMQQRMNGAGQGDANGGSMQRLRERLRQRQQ